MTHPNDYQTTEHYWGCFDHCETEVSARYVVQFLQARATKMSAEDPWRPFSYADIDGFYKDQRRESKNPGENFTFNRLIDGTHVHVSSSPRAPEGKEVLSSYEGFGWRHTCRNVVCVERDGELYRVNDRFREAIASQLMK